MNLKTKVESKNFFPRFYIVGVGGKYSLLHRNTHWYMGCYDTEEEVYDEIEFLNELSLEELYEELIRLHAIFPPRGYLGGTVKFFEENESWFYGAWSVGTISFYEKYPELLHEEDGGEIPYSVLDKIRRKKSLEADLKYRKEMEKVNAEYQKAHEKRKEEVKKEIPKKRVRKKSAPVKEIPKKRRKRKFPQNVAKAISNIF